MSFLATDITSVVEIADTLVAADTTVPHTLMTPQVTPVALGQLFLANSDVVDHNAVISFTNSGNTVAVHREVVPAGAGFTTGPVVNPGGSPFSGLSQPEPIGPGTAIEWNVEESVTLSNFVSIGFVLGVY